MEMDEAMMIGSSSSTSTGASEIMDESAKRKTPRGNPSENAATAEHNSNSQSLIQRLQSNEQGRRIRLYRNGDRFFKVF
jgi:hypothetical protein